MNIFTRQGFGYASKKGHTVHMGLEASFENETRASKVSTSGYIVINLFPSWSGFWISILGYPLRCTGVRQDLCLYNNVPQSNDANLINPNSIYTYTVHLQNERPRI